MKILASLLLVLPLLAACDQLQERMGIPIAAKVEAEGKAIGSACRHAGRGLEDCYRLNPQADKAAVFTGWREMNEYMIKNNMQAVAPLIPPTLPGKAAKHADEEDADAAHAVAKDKAEDKTADTHGANDADKPAADAPGSKGKTVGDAKEKAAGESKGKPGAEDKDGTPNKKAASTDKAGH
jgi:hypothetical protein